MQMNDNGHQVISGRCSKGSLNGSKNKMLRVVASIALGFFSSSALVLAETPSQPPPETAARSAPELLARAPDDGSRPACKNARRYMELLDNNRIQELGSLYAEDVVFYGPQGKTFRGRAAVQGMYLQALSQTTPHTYGSGYYQDGNHCILEIVTTNSEGHAALSAIDHFIVNKEGLYERFIMFMSPPPSLPKGNDADMTRRLLCHPSSDPTVLPTRSDPKLIAPAPADDGSRPACKAARRYIQLVDSGHQEQIGALFAKDAEYYGPRGETLHGRAQINASYAKDLANKSMEIYGASFIQDGNNCFTELVSRPRGSNEPFAMTALDHFTVNKKGLVEKFVTYFSPLASLPNGVAQSTGGGMCPAPTR
jgi:hypothetical protein